MIRLMLLLLSIVWSSLWADDPDPDATPDPADPKDDKLTAYKQFASKQEHDDYINSVIEDRLKRKDQKLEEDKERIEREAKEKALKDNEDWKALAQTHAETIEKHEKKIEGLQGQVQQQTDVEDRNKVLEQRLAGQLKDKRDKIGNDLLREFVEGLPVLEQAEWFEKNADKLEPAPQTEESEDETPLPSGRPAGQPPTGSPATGGKDKAKDEEARQEQRSLGISRI